MAATLLPASTTWGPWEFGSTYGIELAICSAALIGFTIIGATLGQAWPAWGAFAIAMILCGATLVQPSYRTLPIGFWVSACALVTLSVLAGTVAVGVNLPLRTGRVGPGPGSRNADLAGSRTAAAAVLLAVGCAGVVAGLFLPAYSSLSFWNYSRVWSLEAVAVAALATGGAFGAVVSKSRHLALATAALGFIMVGTGFPWGPLTHLGIGVWVQCLSAFVCAGGALLLLAANLASQPAHVYEWGMPRIMRGTVELEGGGTAKSRSFGLGFLLSVATFGIYYYYYYYFWWYLINDELRRVGLARRDLDLSQSQPANSLLAVLLGGFLIVPPIVSIYNTAQRIKQAQRICGIRSDRTIDPTVALLVLFPGGLLIVPTFFTTGI